MPTVPKDDSRVPMTPNQTVQEDFKTMAFGLMRRSQEVEDFTGWKGYLSDVLPQERPPQGELSGTPLAKAAGEDAITSGKSEALGIMASKPMQTAQIYNDPPFPRNYNEARGIEPQTESQKFKAGTEYYRNLEEKKPPGSGKGPIGPWDEIGVDPSSGGWMRRTQAKGTQVAGGSEDVWRSIFQQESSSGKDLRTSSTGAIGPGQIMPGTFKQWAKPGENIRNYDDNIAVSKRMVESYHKQYGGDPARVAVAYFSGPGNVAPAGSSTPWKVDKSDGATRTSKYVQDVIGRMGGSVDAAGVPQARSRGEVWDKAGRYVGGTEETPRFKPDTSWLDAIVNARRGKRRTA